MKKKQKGFLRPYFIYLISITTILSVVAIIVLAIFTVRVAQSKPPIDPSTTPAFAKIHEIFNAPFQDDALENEISSELSILFLNYQKVIGGTFGVLVSMLIILVSTVILLLVLLGCQMIFWQRDRRRLDTWREVGFACERLEFLPANRIRLNNAELELNKTQIESLKKLAVSRIKGEALHSSEMGNHGVQAVKRLREELGMKFFERSLIKARKNEGYWLEIDPRNIHGLPDDSDDDV